MSLMLSGASLDALIVASLLTTALSGWAAPLENAVKISPKERQQLSEDVALKAQRASAPMRASLASSLAAENELGSPCSACSDKDYSDACPLGWAELEDGRCAAPSSYTGVCSNEQIFVGATAAGKMESEIACAICWPCTAGGRDNSATCPRDWAQPCPNGYSPQEIRHNSFGEASGVTCVADFAYEGECEQQVVFKDLEAKMQFAQRCQTSWPCRSACQGDECPGAAAMFEKAPGKQLPKSIGFLAARVLPVDGYRIRNSLFLSQLLRMPAAAAVNIVEQEDANRIYEEAKYKSMEDQVARLDRALETKFRLLSQK